MIDELQGKVVPIKMWANRYDVESAALDQLKLIAALPWAFAPRPPGSPGIQMNLPPDAAGSLATVIIGLSTPLSASQNVPRPPAGIVTIARSTAAL